MKSCAQISFYDRQNSHFMTDKFHFMTEPTPHCGFGHKVKSADYWNQQLTRTVRSLNEILVGHNLKFPTVFGHNLKFSHRTSFLKLSLASAYPNGAKVRLAPLPCKQMATIRFTLSLPATKNGPNQEDRML